MNTPANGASYEGTLYREKDTLIFKVNVKNVKFEIPLKSGDILSVKKDATDEPIKGVYKKSKIGEVGFLLGDDHESVVIDSDLIEMEIATLFCVEKHEIIEKYLKQLNPAPSQHLVNPDLLGQPPKIRPASREVLTAKQS